MLFVLCLNRPALRLGTKEASTGFLFSIHFFLSVALSCQSVCYKLHMEYLIQAKVTKVNVYSMLRE